MHTASAHLQNTSHGYDNDQKKKSTRQNSSRYDSYHNTYIQLQYINRLVTFNLVDMKDMLSITWSM